MAGATPATQRASWSGRTRGGSRPRTRSGANPISSRVTPHVLQQVSRHHAGVATTAPSAVRPRGEYDALYAAARSPQTSIIISLPSRFGPDSRPVYMDQKILNNRGRHRVFLLHPPAARR